MSVIVDKMKLQLSMNKKFLLATASLVLVAAGVITLFLGPRIELPEIKIAINFPSPILFIAAEKGFFEEKGLKVKFETMSSEDSVSALLAGEVDYAYFLPPFIKSSVEASLRGAPIKIIILTEKYQVVPVVTRSGLKLNDLKIIGIVSYPSFYYQGLKFIKENNLKVKIIKVERSKEAETSLTSGMTDAALVEPSSAARLRAQGFQVLDILNEALPSGLSARDDKIEKEPEEVKKVVYALQQAREFIVTEPEETKKLILKLFKLKEVEENLQMVEKMYLIWERRNISADEVTELLTQIVKAGDFETVQEVEEQVVTPEELQKVFDLRFVK